MIQTTFQKVKNGQFFSFESDEDDQFGYIKINNNSVCRTDDKNAVQIYLLFFLGKSKDEPVLAFETKDEFLGRKKFNASRRGNNRK